MSAPMEKVLRADPGRWRDFAACRAVDPEIFFLERAAGVPNREAKAVCAGCPVRGECLEYAMAHPDTCRYGVWGGLGTSDLRRLHQARKAVA